MEARKAKNRRGIAIAAVAFIAVLVPTVAFAHVERASYWPNPAGENVGGVQAGGQVPTVRKLFSALKKKPPGKTRVVCQKNSLKRLKKSLQKAQKKGYQVRPSVKKTKLKKKKAKKLFNFNKKLRKHCRYSSIQAAVNASGNNDRVVIMPGLYTEPGSRQQPTNDASCASLKETNDKGNTGAVSYRYQVACPNDQNLIAVMGRAAGRHAAAAAATRTDTASPTSAPASAATSRWRARA